MDLRVHQDFSIIYQQKEHILSLRLHPLLLYKLQCDVACFVEEKKKKKKEKALQINVTQLEVKSDLPNIVDADLETRQPQD